MVGHFPVITLFGFLSIAKRFSLHLLVADAPLSNEMAQKMVHASLVASTRTAAFIFPRKRSILQKEDNNLTEQTG